MDKSEITKLLSEVEAAIASAAGWRVPAGAASQLPPDAVPYESNSGAWRILAFEFSIEDQGFPPGSVGYDGVASSTEGRLTVMRLPRETAERAVRTAKSWIAAHGASV